MKAGPDGFGWLTEEVKDAVPRGLGRGPDRRLQPLPRDADEAAAARASRRRAIPTLPRERLTVDVPTLVLWALDDVALLPGLLEGLEDYVPKLELRRCRAPRTGSCTSSRSSWRSEIEAFLQPHSVDRRLARRAAS